MATICLSPEQIKGITTGSAIGNLNTVDFFNPSDKDVDVVLTEGNRVASGDTSGSGVRGVVWHEKGKYQIRYTLYYQFGQISNVYFGIANSLVDLTSNPVAPLSTGSVVAFSTEDNTKKVLGRFNDGTGGTPIEITLGGTLTSTTVIDILADFDNNTVTILLDGLDVGVVSIPSGIQWFPYATARNGMTSTIDVAGEGFAPESGYILWNYEEALPLIPEAKSSIVTGSLLTAIPLPPVSGFPLNYARIGYDNALVNGSASATSDNVNSAKMLTPSTYDKWRPTTDSVATLIGTLKQCNYVGIAAHNLGADGVTLTVKVSDGGVYTTVYSQLVTTDNALFIRFAEGTYSNVELTLTGSLTAEIGVVFLGLELEMMRPIFTGHKPANLNATDVMTPQVSDGGQFLGKQIVRQGYATSADFQHLTDEWYRDKFQPFVEHAKVRPYFWAWNLLESPDDVVYGWTNSNIGCSYMGIRNWLQVSFDIEAHA